MEPSTPRTFSPGQKLAIAAVGTALVLLLFTGTAFSQDAGPFVPRNAREAKYANLVQQAADDAGIPASVLAAVVTNESNWNNAGPINSSCGVQCISSSACAIGLAQTLPATAAQMGITGDLCDPMTSLTAGARYLKYLYDRIGDWPTVFIAYRNGPGGVNNPNTASQAYSDKAVSNMSTYQQAGLSGVRLFAPRVS